MSEQPFMHRCLELEARVRVLEEALQELRRSITHGQLAIDIDEALSGAQSARVANSD